MSEKVYIFDEIVVAEERSAALRRDYMARYAPSARARGMTLEGAWRSPPVVLASRDMTLHFLWSVPDVAGWWGMRLGVARANPDNDVAIEGDDEKTAWWRHVDAVAVSRKRSFLRGLEEGEAGDA